MDSRFIINYCNQTRDPEIFEGFNLADYINQLFYIEPNFYVVEVQEVHRDSELEIWREVSPHTIPRHNEVFRVLDYFHCASSLDINFENDDLTYDVTYEHCRKTIDVYRGFSLEDMLSAAFHIQSKIQISWRFGEDEFEEWTDLCSYPPNRSELCIAVAERSSTLEGGLVTAERVKRSKSADESELCIAVAERSSTLEGGLVTAERVKRSKSADESELCIAVAERSSTLEGGLVTAERVKRIKSAERVKRIKSAERVKRIKSADESELHHKDADVLLEGRSKEKCNKPIIQDIRLSVSEIKNMIKKTDVENNEDLSNYVTTELNKWKNTPLDLAITGKTGGGKSTLINSFLGLTSDDPGAAATGVIETTSKPTKYSNPKYPNLRFWDLPGVGTQAFPKDSYVDRNNFKEYDSYLIVSSERFTENDVFLAKKIKSFKKPIYFVRTKLDVDIQNEKRSHPRTFCEKDVVKRIRQNCDKNLKELSCNYKLFIVSSFEKDCGDFQELVQSLVKNSADLKKDALILSLGPVYSNIIDLKKKILKERISSVAFKSAACPFKSLFSSDEYFLYNIIKAEVDFYRDQLFLNDKFLNRVEGNNATTRDCVKTVRRRLSKYWYQRELKEMIELNYTSTTLLFVANAVFLLGKIVVSGVAFHITKSVLNEILDDMAREANSLLKVTMQN